MRPNSFLFLYSHEPWLLPPSLEFIYALKMRGFRVDVLYADRGISKGSLGDFLIDKVYQFSCRLDSFIDRLRFPYKLGLLFHDLLKERRYDVIIACDIVSLHILSKANVSGCIKVYWAFELSGIEKIIGISWDVFRSLFFAAFLRRMDLIIAPSEERKEILSGLIEKAKIIVIGNFRANRFNEPTIDLYKRKGTIYLAFAGKISFAAGIQPVIVNVAKHPNLHLSLAGVMDPIFERWFRSLTFDNVEYRGVIENRKLVSFLRGFDVSVCTYTKQLPVAMEARFPAPTKAGDAIAAGCILLCSDHPYLKSLVDDYQLGYCFCENDLEFTVDKIATLSASEINDFKQRLKGAFEKEYCMDVKVDVLLNELNSCE